MFLYFKIIQNYGTNSNFKKYELSQKKKHFNVRVTTKSQSKKTESHKYSN